jgi:Cd(II)/Pb(II)-responsive transcriptional regulator
MKIGELAQVAQCTVETIRYYEKEGLISEAERTASNYRKYGASHVERLRFIRNCRALDMTHSEIRALLGLMNKPEDDCSAVNHLLDDHIGHVDTRIAELQLLKQQLILLRQQCQTKNEVEACGIIHGITVMENEGKQERHTHLG